MRFTQAPVIMLLGVVASAASSLVPRSSIAHDSEIMGCETGCVVAAGGWPLPYVLDYPAISPVGSVSLVNAVLGVDHFAFGPLLMNLLFWTAVAAAIVVAVRLRRARH